jgi:fructokinase
MQRNILPAHAGSSSHSAGADARYGAIEAGGTKFICAVGDARGRILHDARIDTRDPASTLEQVVRFFAGAEVRYRPLEAFGLAAFGPLELRRESSRYGYITNTPKPGWANTDLLGAVRRAVGRPVGFDTDVNGAALAEYRWGDGQHLDSLVYVTVGTGIGAGVIHHGLPVHGLMHPEVGHIHIRRNPADSGFAGVCPFHGDCLEGLASGPAILARTGRLLSQADSSDPIWSIAADYLGQLCAQLVLMHSPQRIVLGGGVMQHARLFEPIRTRMLQVLHGYLLQHELQAADYISRPSLGSAVGIKGALALAIDAGR